MGPRAGRGVKGAEMLGWAGVLIAMAALSLGASAAPDGGRVWLWDPDGPPPAIPRAGGLTAAGRAALGTCELAMADRARTSSTRCAGCHDGSVGASIEFRMGADRNGMSHPVEVDYAEAAARHPGQYAPPGSLPREVPLVGGKITCTTCHDAGSADPKHVAIPRRLCQACHLL